MTITPADIKLKASERLTDTPDGGGQQIGQEIVDGQLNNVFGPISRLDRAGGDVALRKLFGHVDTAGNEVLFGKHFMFATPPGDPRVSVMAFDTASDIDERNDAIDYIGDFLRIDVPYDLALDGDHFEGQDFIQVYDTQNGSNTAGARQVGAIIALSNQNDPAQPPEYFRVVDVEETGSVFNANYRYRLGLNKPLGRDYFGPEDGSGNDLAWPEQALAANRNTRISSMRERGDRRYYSLTTLAALADAGQTTLQVAATKAAILPVGSSQDVTQGEPLAAQQTAFAGETQTVTRGDANDDWSAGQTYAFGCPIVPGTLQGGGLTDTGQGALVNANGDTQANIDYAGGSIQPVATISDAQWTWETGAALQGSAQTTIDVVADSAPDTIYSRTLDPLPARGSLVIQYRSDNVWRTVVDIPQGNNSQLAGDGGGSINYSTGAVTVSLANTPDPGSAVLWAWGDAQAMTTTQAANKDPVGRAFVELFLGEYVRPGSLSGSWTPHVGGSAACTDSGDGTLAGDCLGSVDYIAGTVRISPDSPASLDATGIYAFNTNTATPETAVSGVSSNATTISGTLDTTAVDAGSAVIKFNVQRLVNGEQETVTRQAVDDGAGGFVGDVTAGSIDYATGAFSITPRLDGYTVREYTLESDPDVTWANGQHRATEAANHTWADIQRTETVGDLDAVAYTSGDAGTSGGGGPFALTGIIDLAHTGASLADSGTSILLNGNDVITTGDLNVYRNQIGSPTSHLATNSVGTVNQAQSRLQITDSAVMQSLVGYTVEAIAYTHEPPPQWQYFGRTGNAPVAPASFSVRAIDVLDTLQSATGDATGDLIAAKVSGHLDAASGAYSVLFGSENTGTWNILYTDPATAERDQTTESPVPLPDEATGIDSTRMPSDGQVPIFDASGKVVIHHTDSTTLPDPLQAGTTYNVGRTDLALIEIYDAEGQRVPDSLFTYDLAAGDITTADPLDLTGFTEPLVAQHRIEDIRQLTGVVPQLLTLLNGLSRQFPAGSYVSSIIPWGDTFSRVETVFDQKVWQGDYLDELVGDDALATYNDLDFPITVTNDGAANERWALVFTSSTNFEIRSESRGTIGTGGIGTTTAPINPSTGTPYFTVPSDGWGTGWVTGNALRFNTVSASRPVWLARVVQPGDAALLEDQSRVELRGDSE